MENDKIIVSILDGTPIYGIDYSDRGATVIEITRLQYNDIDSGKAYIDGTNVVYVEIPEEIIEDKKKEERRVYIIEEVKKVQDLSLQKRLEYTTVRDMLPEGNPIRDMKMQVLEYEGDKLLLQYEALVQELIENYGQSALFHII